MNSIPMVTAKFLTIDVVVLGVVLSVQSFYEAVELYKRMRARFDQRRVLKNEYELLVKFDEHTYNLFGLYQQAIVGDINVPKMDYFDPQETSWMWGWIKGNQKWHAWNKCKGLSKFDAMFMYINEVQKLESELSSLVDEWKDEQDPRIPDQNAWVSEEEAEERCAIIEKAKAERRKRDAVKRKEEEAAGMWDE